MSLGDLDRVTAWLTVNGFVNAEPGYPQTTAVMNPLSDLIVELYGMDAGAHARTAIGVATVPLNLPIVIAAEAEISKPDCIGTAVHPRSQDCEDRCPKEDTETPASAHAAIRRLSNQLDTSDSADEGRARTL